MKKHLANIITSCRIFLSILILIFPVISLKFYITYFVCGFTDMIDGAVARATNSRSEIGSGFDSIADLVFMTASLIKLLPLIHIPIWLWIWIFAILGIKIINIISVFICSKKLIFPHTITNKITGFLMFLLPFTLNFIELKYSVISVCFMATLSAIEEIYFVKKLKTNYTE